MYQGMRGQILGDEVRYSYVGWRRGGSYRVFLGMIWTLDFTEGSEISLENCEDRRDVI